MKKLFTGKTPKQELAHSVALIASNRGITASEALSGALDGGEYSPIGSIKRAMWQWWESASTKTQDRFLAEAKSELRKLDIILQRTVER